MIDGISPVQSTRGDLHFLSSIPFPNAATEMFMGISSSRNRLSLPLVLMVKMLGLNRVKRR